MPDPDLLTIGISALVGAVTSYVGAVIKTYFDMNTKIDEQLRERRLDPYKEIWLKTAILPRWPRATGVTYAQLRQFSGDLRDWYFGQGGIYMSARTRDAYFAVQEALAQVALVPDVPPPPADQPVPEPRIWAGIISSAEYDLIRGKCSALRTELTTDIQSRRRAAFWRG
jgi:hypothetical protein